MSAGLIDLQYYVYLVAWLVIPIALFAFSSRRDRLAGVLVYAYLAGFFINHWMGALVHASPQSGFINTEDTVSGFNLSTLGLFAFACGVLLAGSRLGKKELQMRASRRPLQTIAGAPPRLIRSLLIVGIATWILSFTPVGSLPSAAAVLSSGKQCLVLAVCLSCWFSWQQGKIKSFRLWLAAALVLPVVTVLTEGFIGYGIMMLTTVLVFIAMFYRPRWRLLAGLVVGLYAGMSFWVAYASNRYEVRASVWGGADYQTRLSRFVDVFKSLEPFDFTNPKHLEPIDLRLNQNWLVGAAVRTTPWHVPFENGETLYAAVLAIVPRALWPDKPSTGGSGDYVSKHTMVQFAEGVSVGMGQVFELYVNFGTAGVLVGFLFLGWMLRHFDLRLVRAMEQRDYNNLLFYFLVGAGALQVGGSLTEVVAAMGGAALLSIVASRFIHQRVKLQRNLVLRSDVRGRERQSGDKSAGQPPVDFKTFAAHGLQRGLHDVEN